MCLYFCHSVFTYLLSPPTALYLEIKKCVSLCLSLCVTLCVSLCISLCAVKRDRGFYTESELEPESVEPKQAHAPVYNVAASGLIHFTSSTVHTPYGLPTSRGRTSHSTHTEGEKGGGGEERESGVRENVQ
uniref:Uncharacterized protein n=1 Tax=Periophthalmus magnuspinnatus TaxID=409849 RepID=A0A3B4AWX0_9GOBI